jgi:hypothetical protein
LCNDIDKGVTQNIENHFVCAAFSCLFVGKIPLDWPHGANIRMIQQVLSNKLEINISTFANVQHLLYIH